jgi:hypothetical protein
MVSGGHDNGAPGLPSDLRPRLLRRLHH